MAVYCAPNLGLHGDGKKPPRLKPDVDHNGGVHYSVLFGPDEFLSIQNQHHGWGLVDD